MVDPATAIASSTMGVTVPVAEETSHSWRGVPGMAIETEVRVPSTLSTMNMPGSRVAPTSAYPAGRLSALTRPSVEIVTSAAAPVRTYPPPASGSSDPPAAQVRYQPAAVGRGIRCASPEVPTMASPRDPSGIAASVASVEPSVTALSSREPGRRSTPGDQACDAGSNHHRRPARLPIEEMSPSARRRSPCHPTSVSSPAGGSREGSTDGRTGGGEMIVRGAWRVAPRRPERTAITPKAMSARLEAATAVRRANARRPGRPAVVTRRALCARGGRRIPNASCRSL